MKFLEVSHTAAEGEQEDLPEGWGVRYDSKTKRKYYVDHKNKKTQWHKPGAEVL